MTSKKEIQETLRKQKKEVVLATVVAFLLLMWLTGAAARSLIYALGALIAYYVLIAEHSRFQKLYFKIIIIGGTAGWFTVGTLFLVVYFDLFVPSKENRLLFISIAVVVFIIGACLGNLLLKKTKLRWLVED